MTYFVVKVTLRDGDYLHPYVASFENDDEAIRAVKSAISNFENSEDCIVETKDVKDSVFLEAFGSLKHGTIAQRSDYIWSKEDEVEKTN